MMVSGGMIYIPNLKFRHLKGAGGGGYISLLLFLEIRKVGKN
jgi:hypothetical protein